MATWVEDIVTALQQLGGVGTLQEIYQEIEKIREPARRPRTWKAIVRAMLERYSSDSAMFQGTDLFYSVEGIGSGAWGLRSLASATPTAADLAAPFEGGSKNPQKMEVKTYRILRDTKIARALKALYKDTCQLCGTQITLSGGKTYSEAHHIQPLGAPHNGPDIAANIIVLCPNCHVLCDYGAIQLDRTKMRMLHPVGQEFIDYHNTHIYQQDSA